MDDERDHAGRVDAWLERAVEGAPPAIQLERFATAFDAVWTRARLTLGDVTLGAIVDRVLYTAAERYPTLAALALTPEGAIQYEHLRARVGTAPDPALTDGIRFVLVEFLTVLGNLTADILTPELHAELAGVALGTTPSGTTNAPSAPPATAHPASEDRRS